jgi:hypothetical protein
MKNHWMLRTYGIDYDPWQRPITVGMEEPWLVRADDYKQMTTGESACLYLMNPKTAFGRASKAIFAVGEVRRAWMAGPLDGSSTPESAVRAQGSAKSSKTESISVRYTKVLDTPITFGAMDEALQGAGRLPKILTVADLVSCRIEPEDWDIIERLHT